MSRVDELREFVESGTPGETLELPHSSAAQLLSEIDSIDEPGPDHDE